MCSLRANTAAREADGGHIALNLPLSATTPSVEEVMWEVPAKRSTSGMPTMEGICETYAVSFSYTKQISKGWSSGATL